MKKTAKTIILMLTILALAAGACCPALAANAERSYEFALKADKNTTNPGDTVTVTLTLTRTDNDAPFYMYAMDDTILYDAAKLELSSVEIKPEDYEYAAAEGSVRVFYVSEEVTGDETPNPLEVAVLTFTVVGDDFSAEITQEGYEMSTTTGMNVYKSTANSVTISAGEQQPQTPTTPTAPSVPDDGEAPKEPEEWIDDVVFYDVSPENWFYDEVYSAAGMGLIRGKSNENGDYFDPYEELNYAQAIALAVRAYQHINGLPITDNPQGAEWYSVYVDIALEKGLISKTFDDYSAVISRGEMALIFSRALGDGQAVLNKDGAYFSDVSAGSEYCDAIYALFAAGITEGMDSKNRLFGVDNTLKRSEAAAIIYRMVEPDARKTVG